jgi:oxygen-independent coproporphyrinogen-3 oxidase
MDSISHLYIHLPFCGSRCGYCDFFSEEGRLGDAPAYVDALLAELAAAPELAGGDLKTVYLGGGTPSLLGESLLGRLLGAARGRQAPGAEVTIEANPATVTPELAAALPVMGVNRVSLGVQSFSPRLRRRLGRQGPVEAVGPAVSALRTAGIGNIGLDLIFGIPGEELVELETDLRRALALKPEHLSCYELTVKAGSDYDRRWSAELEVAASNGRLFYETVVDTLEEAGYQWYETSNFARPGFECRHNLAYWGGEYYIGLGALPGGG